MTRKTKSAKIYPFGKGLDLTSIPGSQDPRSLSVAKNIILNNRGSLKKRQGVDKVDYIGKEDGNLQGAIHFFATTGGGQRSEIIRVIDGRVEAIRDGNIVDLGISVSPTDTVTFERFANLLIIHFENTRPQQYTIGGTLSDLTLVSGHEDSPPTFARSHQFRYWYGGRPASPHILNISAINDPNTYTLDSGGFGMLVNDGDGDPLGLTGLSPTFRGDLYAFKLNSIYRIYASQFGYGVDQVTNEVGCIHHNTIIATQNDVIFVSAFGIHSLANTDKYGSIEESLISAPIFEAFQERVNWSAANKMIAVYDKPSNCYLLSYASSGSSVNNRVIGFNLLSKEFFEWEDIEYPVMTKFYDFNRQRVLIGDQSKGMGVLREGLNTHYGDPISLKISTGVLFPSGDPKNVQAFTKAFLLMKPTPRSVKFNFSYFIDGDLIKCIEFDTLGGGTKYKGTDAGDIGSAIIGSSLIGKNKSDMKIIQTPLVGDGHSIQFELEHVPPEGSPDQDFEAYGIEFEYEPYETEDTAESL